MAADNAGFESYLRGSWWNVQIKEERSSMFLVSYNADEHEDWPWVPLTELRLSSRSCDGWDCYALKEGIDVAVLAKHPYTVSQNLQKEGLYDARLSSIARFIHAPGECSCKFSVQFFNVQLDTFTGGIHGNLLNRFLLTDEPETEVSISDIRILQKPAEIIPLEDILEAHLDGKCIPLSKCCQDTYHLSQTELSTTKQPRGVFVQGHTDPTHLRSNVILSPSPAGVSTKNGEKESNGDSPANGPQRDVRGTRQSLRRAERDDGIIKSAPGAPGNHERKQAARFADATSPPSTDVKRECVSAEDSDDDRSNGITDEAPQKKKRGRPSLERLHQTEKESETMPGTRAQILEGKKIGNNPKVNLTSGLNKDLESKKKEKKGHTSKDEVDIECTELSSDDSDSQAEWKPSIPLKKLPTMPYNIRTRDRTIHKARSKETQEIRGILGRSRKTSKGNCITIPVYRKKLRLYERMTK